MRWNKLYDGTRESLAPKSHRPHKAHTEQEIKWIDVKYVPTVCYSENDDEKFYQYTVMEESSRKRFI